MTSDLETRLTVIEDRIAISELRARYSFLVDQGKGRDAVNLFTDDGEFHGPKVSYRGRAEQMRHHDEHLLSGMWHFNTNEVIRIDGETATGECYCFMPCVFDEESYVCACRYDDVLTKEAGEWRFKSRRVTFFYFVPLKEGWARSACNSLSQADQNIRDVARSRVRPDNQGGGTAPDHDLQASAYPEHEIVGGVERYLRS